MQVKAFKGWRFDPDVVDDPSLAISPPYDVIDDEKRKSLIEQSPHNIVQVILPDVPENETEDDNRYTRAADLYRKWKSDGVLKADDEPTIYVYGQTFPDQGAARTRLGFIGACKLAEFGDGILPHEWTIAGHKEDRLRLTRATKAQFGNIFVLYTDPEMKVDAILQEVATSEPLLAIQDPEGVQHSLWAITDKAKVSAIEEDMAERQLLVADGHHRYETALTYWKENRDLEEAEYQLMTFVNTKNEGLVILPTHRLVKNLEKFDLDDFLDVLEEEFAVQTFAGGPVEDRRRPMFSLMKEGAETRGKVTFGVYTGDAVYHAATMKSAQAMRAVPGDHSDAWKGLDVTILHSAVLDKLLGIDEAKLDGGDHVEYVKGVGDAFEQAVQSVDEGRCHVAFFLNPPTMEAVEAVAEAGDRMPRKSTFFHPKVFSGLVVHDLE